MDANSKIKQRGVWYGGAISGIIAGLVMAVVLMIHSQFIGNGFFTPVLAIAGTFFGVSALAGGFGTVLTGLILHVIVSAVLGIIFAMIVNPETSSGYAFFGGLVFGIAVWAVMTYLVLPWANPVMRSEVLMHPGMWAFCHLVYGGVLASTPYFERTTAPKYFRPSQSAA